MDYGEQAASGEHGGPAEGGADHGVCSGVEPDQGSVRAPAGKGRIDHASHGEAGGDEGAEPIGAGDPAPRGGAASYLRG